MDVGVLYQGFVLSLLLFIIVLEALSREFHSGIPWELLYDDDHDECIATLKAWKEHMEQQYLRVNMSSFSYFRFKRPLSIMTLIVFVNK